MNVDLIEPFDISFEVPKAFIQEFPFLRNGIDHKCLHVGLTQRRLDIHIDPISSKTGILNGPNGVLDFLSFHDGSFPGSIPHDVTWEFAKELSEKLGIPVSEIRRFGDFIYCWTVFAYGGRNLWTRLTNRFCFKVAFPFGNFLKVHNLPLPGFSAPFIVIALAPAALWMFLFNRKFHNAKLIKACNIEVIADGKNKIFRPKK